MEGGVPIFGPGDVIADKFRVERYVGEGGMAFVLEATHLELDERVALKFIHPAFRKQEAIVARFRAEARASARMKGEHIARVMDVSSTEDGHPFIVMEYLDGEDLGQVIERRVLPDRAEAIGWLIETCEALAEAHANGIVHRDVKPENLFLVARLGGRKSVKLLDFGISKLALTSGTNASSGLHVGVTLIGTPSYMAPEQIRSAKNADPRSDQWSVGAVLFELLSGRLPFEGPSVPDVCRDVLESPHRRLRDIVPDLDPALELIVDRCLEKDAANRFASVGDLALALLPYAHPRYHANVDRMIKLLRAAGLTTAQLASIPPPAPPAATSGPPDDPLRVSLPRVNTLDQSGASEVPHPRAQEKSNKPLLALAFAALLIAGVAAFLFLRPSPPNASSPPEEAVKPVDVKATGQAAATQPPTRASEIAAPDDSDSHPTSQPKETGKPHVKGPLRTAGKSTATATAAATPTPYKPPLDIKLER
jgi:serine/threonine protein kinase